MSGLKINNAQATPDLNANSKAFIGVERRYIKRIYLGGAKDGVEVHGIKKFTEQKSVYPTFVRMMKSRRKGTVGLGVRINVIAVWGADCEFIICSKYCHFLNGLFGYMKQPD